MVFILGKDRSEKAQDDPGQLNARLVAYREHLESIRDNLPVAAYEFAIAEWHYDPQNHQCPHDAWVESLVIAEPSSGKRREKRSLEIHLRLLGAYQGWIH